MTMQTYGDYNGTSGVTGYAIDPNDNFIKIEYTNGGVYTYRKKCVGEVNFRVMKALAEAGNGLNGYINKHVRNRAFNREAKPVELVTISIMTTSAVAVELLSDVLTKVGVEFNVS